MKKALQNTSDALFGALLMSIALLALSMCGCSPRISYIVTAPAPLVILDTVEIYVGKTDTDTLLLTEGKTWTVPFDSVHWLVSSPLEPAVITRYESLTDTVFIPAAPAQITNTVRDTVYVPTYVSTAVPGPVRNMSWPERLTWMIAVAALLVAWWKKWKDDQPATSHT